MLFIGASKTVHVLHNSEHPASVFSILDTGTKQIPLVADGLFDVLMLKMTPIYTSKKQAKVNNVILDSYRFIVKIKFNFRSSLRVRDLSTEIS